MHLGIFLQQHYVLSVECLLLHLLPGYNKRLIYHKTDMVVFFIIFLAYSIVIMSSSSALHQEVAWTGRVMSHAPTGLF